MEVWISAPPPPLSPHTRAHIHTHTLSTFSVCKTVYQVRYQRPVPIEGIQVASPAACSMGIWHCRHAALNRRPPLDSVPPHRVLSGFVTAPWDAITPVKGSAWPRCYMGLTASPMFTRLAGLFTPLVVPHSGVKLSVAAHSVLSTCKVLGYGFMSSSII